MISHEKKLFFDKTLIQKFHKDLFSGLIPYGPTMMFKERNLYVPKGQLISKCFFLFDLFLEAKAEIECSNMKRIRVG